MIGIEAHRDAKTAPCRVRLANAQHAFTMPNTSKPIGELSESDKARFFAKINKDGPTMPNMESECWEWKGVRNPKGYGIARAAGGARLAHRVAYQIESGPIPEGLHCLHKCDNSGCVNPAHLWLGTNAQNHADKERKGRGHQAFGEAAGKAKLTERNVMEMRVRFSLGETCNSLAKKFGVLWGTANRAITGSTWKHIQ